MPKASIFGGRGHIPLPHPPPMASKAGHAWLRCGLLLLHLTEHPPHQNPGYTPVWLAYASEIGTTSQQRTRILPPMCPLFRGSTVLFFTHTHTHTHIGYQLADANID